MADKPRGTMSAKWVKKQEKNAERKKAKPGPDKTEKVNRANPRRSTADETGRRASEAVKRAPSANAKRTTGERASKGAAVTGASALTADAIRQVIREEFSSLMGGNIAGSMPAPAPPAAAPRPSPIATAMAPSSEPTADPRLLGDVAPGNLMGAEMPLSMPPPSMEMAGPGQPPPMPGMDMPPMGLATGGADFSMGQDFGMEDPNNPIAAAYGRRY